VGAGFLDHVELLAQGPEADDQLLLVHADRYSGHRSLPTPAQPPTVLHVTGHSVGRRILGLGPARRLKVEVRIKINIKIVQSRIKR